MASSPYPQPTDAEVPPGLRQTYRSGAARLERSVYTHLLQRWWWTLLLAAWVAGLVGYLVASQIPPTYETRARLLVGPVNTDVNTVRAAEGLSQTYAELATTEPQLQRVVERLGLDMDASELAGRVTVVANGVTRILSIRASDQDPERAAIVANGVADELVALTTTSVRRPEGELSLVDPAQVPVSPTGPNVSLITFLAASAGLLTAGALAAALEYFSHTIKSRSDLADLAGTTVLGEINLSHGFAGTPVQPLVVEAQPDSRTTLGYRQLVSRMPLGDQDDSARVRTMLIVGSQAGERTGEFAANAAAVIARTGRSVTLLDADEVDAHVTGMFVPEGRVGLSELLDLSPEVIATTDVLDNVRIRRGPAIEIIPAGNREAPALPEDMAATILDALRSRSDLVVISGSSLDRSATALVWARLVDAVVVAARADTTRVENLRSALDSLRLVDANLVGAVLLERQRGGTRRRKHRKAGKAGTLDDLHLRARPMTPPTNQAAAQQRGASRTEGAPRSAKSADRRAVGDKSAG